MPPRAGNARRFSLIPTQERGNEQNQDASTNLKRTTTTDNFRFGDYTWKQDVFGVTRLTAWFIIGNDDNETNQ